MNTQAKERAHKTATTANKTSDACEHSLRRHDRLLECGGAVKDAVVLVTSLSLPDVESVHSCQNKETSAMKQK